MFSLFREMTFKPEEAPRVFLHSPYVACLCIPRNSTLIIQVPTLPYHPGQTTLGPHVKRLFGRGRHGGKGMVVSQNEQRFFLHEGAMMAMKLQGCSRSLGPAGRSLA